MKGLIWILELYVGICSLILEVKVCWWQLAHSNGDGSNVEILQSHCSNWPRIGLTKFRIPTLNCPKVKNSIFGNLPKRHGWGWNTKTLFLRNLVCFEKNEEIQIYYHPTNSEQLRLIQYVGITMSINKLFFMQELALQDWLGLKRHETVWFPV